MRPIDKVTINYRHFPRLARLQWPHFFEFTISGLPRDHIFEVIKASRTFYERDLLEEIAVRVPDSYGTVIDVGANIGNHSLFFSNVLKKHVISIEPQQAATDLLKLNMTANLQMNDIEILRLGIGERPGTASIIQDIQTDRLGLGAARLAVNRTITNAETVEVSTIDVLCNARQELPALQLIKIDTEGMEGQVLRGASETIAKYRPLIVVEAATTSALNDVESILLPQGYTQSGPFAWTPTFIFSTTPLSDVRKFIWKAVREVRSIVQPSSHRGE